MDVVVDMVVDVPEDPREVRKKPFNYPVTPEKPRLRLPSVHGTHLRHHSDTPLKPPGPSARL
ncbi:hypothetical protein GCM10009654_27970 [Streptomyces hebeiensis]|uniref:Uncharacterized protein n=1 Tax=Streptomyces hebeiensis TaxID=229486 RepID=A0ABP4FEL6_9ACTN